MNRLGFLATVVAAGLTLHALPFAQAVPPVRVDTAVALKQVVKRIEPVFDAKLATTNPGAVLAADVVVSANGTVESVSVVTAPQGLERAFEAALKQWMFKPFLVNGRPTRIVTMIDILLANPREEDERKVANEFASAQLSCERALATGASDVTTVCGRATTLSEQLPSRALLERSHASGNHALGLLIAGRNAEALKRFEQAVDVRRRALRNEGVDIDADADLGTLIGGAAEAHVRLKNLKAADTQYTTAIAVFERAIATAVPELRNRSTQSLRAALRRAADTKRALGQLDQARRLESKAVGLPSTLAERMPAMRVVQDVLLMGPLGPLMSDDDVRQVRALVPAGKRPWLIVGDMGYGDGNRLMVVQVYLEPDVSTADNRRGRVAVVQAAWPDGAQPAVKKIWKRWHENTYVQVPIAGRDPQQVRGSNDRNRPILIQRSPAEPLTPEEAAVIVRFVRAAADARPQRPSSGSSRETVYTQIQPWVIEWITRWSASDVDVELRENLTVNGPGQTVKLRKQGANWRVVELRPLGL